jgi:DNA replicative helicase MCM subunit Mcm2 (Cdc46/Mcm family)
MCSANKASLEVSYVHLGDQAPILAIWLADVPRDMLEIFDEVLKEVVLTDFPHYSQVSPSSSKARTLRSFCCAADYNRASCSDYRASNI